MYESPIKVFQGNLEMQFESEILKAVQRADITIDGEELIRALRYDRKQYQKGFDDARKDATPVIRCKNCTNGMVSVDGKYIICCVLGVGMKFDDFCSYGERKDEANES